MKKKGKLLRLNSFLDPPITTYVNDILQVGTIINHKSNTQLIKIIINC